MAGAVVGFDPAPRKPNWNGPHYVCIGCRYDHKACQLSVVCGSAQEINEPNEFGSQIPH